MKLFYISLVLFRSSKDEMPDDMEYDEEEEETFHDRISGQMKKPPPRRDVKAEAMVLGEITKPSWQSRNEGIHERVNFEDSIWGFDLAGGIYYNTPLRVTRVNAGSRAEKAGIKPGDKLLRINDIDTSTLTIQEAHEIIIESGIHIRLAVSAPDDLEDSYSCWEDKLEHDSMLDEELMRKKKKEAKRRVRVRINNNWSLQWPWVSKRRVIYKESNCYMVPSKYENKHRDKFPDVPTTPTKPKDIVLMPAKLNDDITDGTDAKVNGNDLSSTNGVDDNNPPEFGYLEI